MNGCEPADWVDATGQPAVDIRFGGPLGRNYAPRCVDVSPGTRIRFLGPFETHPLVGGRLERGLPLPGQGSTRFAPVASGDGAEFELEAPGVFGYYCDLHAVDGMLGAVRVLPLRAGRS